MILAVVHLMPVLRQLKVGILSLLWSCRFDKPSLIALCLVDRPDPGSTSADEVLVGPSAGVGVLSSSGNVPGEGANVAGVESEAVKRGRTQHTRPAEGLERSVLHNEWEKGWLLCLSFIPLGFWLLLVCNHVVI